MIARTACDSCGAPVRALAPVELAELHPERWTELVEVFGPGAAAGTAWACTQCDGFGANPSNHEFPAPGFRADGLRCEGCGGWMPDECIECGGEIVCVDPCSLAQRNRAAWNRWVAFVGRDAVMGGTAWDCLGCGVHEVTTTDGVILA